MRFESSLLDRRKLLRGNAFDTNSSQSIRIESHPAHAVLALRAAVNARPNIAAGVISYWLRNEQGASIRG